MADTDVEEGEIKKKIHKVLILPKAKVLRGREEQGLINRRTQRRPKQIPLLNVTKVICENDWALS